MFKNTFNSSVQENDLYYTHTCIAFHYAVIPNLRKGRKTKLIISSATAVILFHYFLSEKVV